MVSVNNQHLYILGGYSKPKCLCRIELDVENSVATMRRVQEVNTGPSPRYGHVSVMIGSSLMAVWGGGQMEGNGDEFCDIDLHLLNLSEPDTCSTPKV